MDFTIQSIYLFIGAKNYKSSGLNAKFSDGNKGTAFKWIKEERRRIKV
ncbi:hypothetical protein [Algivirga pacifica]